MKKRKISLAILLSFTLSTSIFTSGCALSYITHNIISESNSKTTNTSKESLFIENEENSITSPEENHADNYYIEEDIHYYFKQLSEDEKKAYSALLTGCMNFDDTITVHITDEDQLSKVTEAVTSDHPELFWCDGSYEYIIYNTYTTISPTYIYTQAEAGTKRKEIGSVTNAFLASIPVEATDYDKIKLAYDYVITTVSYDDAATDNQNIYSSMVNKSTVCAGYARAVQYLLQQMDIECLYVFGDIADRDSHAWNIVNCNGNYYQLDATFGDRKEADFQATKDISEADYQKYLDSLPDEMTCNYNYLFCTDTQIYTDHLPTMQITLPACNANDLNHCVLNGRYYENYSDQFWTDMRSSVYSGDKIWECQFANTADYQQVLTQIENDAYADIVINYLEDISAYGEFQMWYTKDDALLTISCWY